MKKQFKKKRGLSTNLAAEFFVASQLNRCGHTVMLTLGNTKEIDLVVFNEAGEKISIDTKGLKNKSNWVVTPKLVRKDHFFALVCYANQFSLPQFDGHHPEVFIIPSIEIKRVLKNWSGRKEVTCVNYRDIKDSKYKGAWKLLSR